MQPADQAAQQAGDPPGAAAKLDSQRSSQGLDGLDGTRQAALVIFMRDKQLVRIGVIGVEVSQVSSLMARLLRATLLVYSYL